MNVLPPKGRVCQFTSNDLGVRQFTRNDLGVRQFHNSSQQFLNI